MKKENLANGLVKCTAEEGCHIHFIGQYAYVRSIAIPESRMAEVEEVGDADIPKFTPEQYDAKVSELIHLRYSADAETALINNRLDGGESEEWKQYMAFRNECKAEARKILNGHDED